MATVLIAGLLHWDVNRAERAGSPMCMICFQMEQNRVLLPAFGEFTGPRFIRPVFGDRICSITCAYLVSIPISLLQPLE
jgi:hypothetical protein